MNLLYKKKIILGNSLEHFLLMKNSSISQVNILADWSKYTGFKLLSNILVMVWLLANKHQ